MVSQEWHWEQAVKFGLESIKTALLLNGGAAIALLTFAGNVNRRNLSSVAIGPLWSFALGAILAALAFFAAYHTQREYGNAESPANAQDQRKREQIWRRGRWWNAASVILMLLSVVAFAAGIVLTANVLPELAAG